MIQHSASLSDVLAVPSERFPFLKDDGGLRRRPRKLLTATQSKRLHEVLLRTHFPTTEEREAIAKELNLTPRKGKWRYDGCYWWLC